MFHRDKGKDKASQTPEAREAKSRTEDSTPAALTADTHSTQGRYGLKTCYDSPSQAIVEIVFVHGLTGNRESTWTDKRSGTFWPQDILFEDLPKSRIFTYGYDADITHFWSMGSRSRLHEHARTFLNALSQCRERSETDERPILFVAHSLGGLLVEDMLLASKNSAEPHLRKILASTRGIAFLGTPHCGSNLATWAAVFSNLASLLRNSNTALLEVLTPESEVLARIQQEFQQMLRARTDAREPQIDITCYFEDLPVRGVGEIVKKNSAILPAYSSIGIRANHMDMTKFSDREDPGYSAVSNELWRWTRNLSRAPAASSDHCYQPTGQGNPHQPFQGLQGFLQARNQGIYQAGNLIQNQSIPNSGRVVQGNSFRSDSGDLTFNFG